MIHALLNATLPLLLATAPAAAPAAPVAPRFEVEADTLRADSSGSWNLAFRIRNPGPFGVYGDSLSVDATDLDPGVSRAARTTTRSYHAFARSIVVPASDDDYVTNFTMPAQCERAAIVLRLHVHDGAGTPYAFRGVLAALPGEPTATMPSEFLTVQGHRVEVVSATAAGGPVPGVLLVPAETAHARSLARTAARLAALGMNVVAVSPPGYGQSAGPPDLCGPATLAALEAALAKLAALPGTDRRQLALWGSGRGATAALLLAARHPEIVRVVAQDAFYDLWATWRAADAATAADIVTEAGTDSAAWKARSPLVSPAAPPGTKLLVIQGSSAEGSTLSARAFVAARLASGGAVDTLFASGATRRLAADPLRAAARFVAPGSGE